MKRIISIVLTLMLISVGCLAEENSEQFKGLNDPELLPYMEDTIYQAVVDSLNSDEYFVENVSAIYISDEYLEELAFNSQANIYFGFTLDELEQQFQGERYVFTLSDTNETTVKPWEPYVNPMDKVIENVAVGTGVILICVTVSVVSAGAGAPAMCMIFAVAAKTGTVAALSGGAIGAAAGGIVEYIQTGDVNKALTAAAVKGSEGYKWGAITGAVSGGAGEAIALKGATMSGLTMNEAATIQMESEYPLSLIKEFHSIDEYNVYKEAGLKPSMIGNRRALIRDIDWNYRDGFGRTNLERIATGENPLDPTGIPYEVHHVGQKNDSVFAILTQAEHRGEGNFRMLHENLRSSVVDHGADFAKEKVAFWKNLYAALTGGA